MNMPICEIYDKSFCRFFYEADKDFENFFGLPTKRKEQGFPAGDFHKESA